MLRQVAATLRLEVARPTTVVLQIAAAEQPGLVESMTLQVDGTPVRPRALAGPHGTRLHVVDAPAGQFDATYTADLTGSAPPLPADEAELLTYLRPSRYCESDTLGPTARAEFAGLTGVDLLAAVSSWVGTRLSYVPGSSGPTDGAVRTLLARQGVCRDYAHLVVALLRALDVPARLAAVYAPGLAPMDFHAVAEAHVGGGWHVVDATTLAPRGALVRIATGRDASDTAFLSVHHGLATLSHLEVSAVADTLPADDLRVLVALA